MRAVGRRPPGRRDRRAAATSISSRRSTSARSSSATRSRSEAPRGRPGRCRRSAARASHRRSSASRTTSSAGSTPWRARARCWSTPTTGRKRDALRRIARGGGAADRAEVQPLPRRQHRPPHQPRRGRPVAVDDETAHLLDYAATCHEISDGLFDITSGVLRRVWRFDGGDRVPDRRRRAEVLAHVGWHRVTWQRPALTLPAGMEIDLGGIGKEYAVDRAAALVAARTASAVPGELRRRSLRQRPAARRTGRGGRRRRSRADRRGRALPARARRAAAWPPAATRGASCCGRGSGSGTSWIRGPAGRSRARRARSPCSAAPASRPERSRHSPICRAPEPASFSKPRVCASGSPEPTGA